MPLPNSANTREIPVTDVALKLKDKPPLEQRHFINHHLEAIAAGSDASLPNGDVSHLDVFRHYYLYGVFLDHSVAQSIATTINQRRRAAVKRHGLR